MDRPQRPARENFIDALTWNWAIRNWAWAAICFALWVLPSAERATAESEPAIHTTDITTEKPPSSDSEEKAPPSFVKGIFYGYLLFVSADGRRIEIKPEGKIGPVETFVMDRLTKIREDKRVAKRKNLKIGQKIAVRYFGLSNVRVAEIVFIVHGEFKPADYAKSYDKPKKK